MSHLSPERLAALLDEQPTAAELAHLAACRPCSRERGAYEALASMSRNVPSIGQPLTSWDKLAPALRKDGVLISDIGAARRARLSRGWMQAAAAVLLVVGGAAFGRITARQALPVDGADTAFVEPTFASIEEAQQVAARSQNVYQAATAFIATQDPVTQSLSTPSVIKTRLAALEQVSQILGPALEDAPYDPVVNNLYLSAQGQRAASIRMLNTASTRAIAY
jgi:hypothetical protein